MRTYRKSMGRGKGIQHYRFVQDMPITDEYFSYILKQFEDELSTEADLQN